MYQLQQPNKYLPGLFILNYMGFCKETEKKSQFLFYG